MSLLSECIAAGVGAGLRRPANALGLVLRLLLPLGDAAAAAATAASMLLLGGVLLRLLMLKQLAMLPCCSRRGDDMKLLPLMVLLPLAALLLLLMELTRSTAGAAERMPAMLLLLLPMMSGTTRRIWSSVCAKKQVDLRGQSGPLVHSCVRNLQGRATVGGKRPCCQQNRSMLVVGRRLQQYMALEYIKVCAAPGNRAA
jgi:hypothetical protein